MIEMEYLSKMLREPITLASGEIGGYNYYVLSLGTHPCGYVELPKTHKYFNVDYDNIPVECHGGLTYGRNFLHTVAAPTEDRFFIGWDYAHYVDYMGYYTAFDHPYSYKWTTGEIVKECLDVIRQLKELDEEE